MHEQTVPASAWAAYALGESYRAGLHRRMRRLGLDQEQTDRRLAEAQDWRSRAVLDAAVRALTRRQGRRRDIDDRLGGLLSDPGSMPEQAWFARPVEPPTEEGEPQVVLRAAVLLRVRGQADDPPDPSTLPLELQAALGAPPARPAARLLDAVRATGPLAWPGLLVLVLLAGSMVVAETVVLRGALDDPDPLRAILAALGLATVLAAVQAGLAARVLTLGRRLEHGLRALLTVHLPLLPDRFLRSRPSSDMAGRAHVLHELRTLPLLLGQGATAAVELLVLAATLIVLHPPATPLVLLATVLVGVAAGAIQLPLREREQRHREHAAALAHLELDAVLAVHPVRSLDSATVLSSEHDERMGCWRSPSS